MIESDTLTWQPLSFQQVYEGQDPPIVVYDAVGWGTNKQAGDFTRLRIAGTTEDKQKLDSYGVWTKVDEHIKLPVNSSTIKKHPYYIVLNEGSAIPTLLLFGRSYEGGPNSLTPIRVGKTRISPMYSSFFSLHEIIETEQGYRLLGTGVSEKEEECHYERLIEKSY